MKLTCPSCASEYEVDASAIGARGRMVRCANCGAEWFQSPAEGAEAAPAPPPPPAPEPVQDYAAEAPTYDPMPEPAPVVQDYAPPVQDRGFAPAPAASRGFEQEPVERIYYDVDPGGAPVVEENDVVEETRVRRRRDQDRDDMAASLAETEEDRPAGTGGAFLAGFSTVAVLAVVLIAVYVKAPDIAQVAPGVEGPLTGFISMVDQGRFALAAAVQ